MDDETLRTSAQAHRYLSTACLHDEHGYCSAPQRPDGTAKEPASCKFCGAPCVCVCHGEGAGRG